MSYKRNKNVIVFLILAAMLININDIFASTVQGPSTNNPDDVNPSRALSVKIKDFLKSRNNDLLNLENSSSFETAFKLDGSGVTQIGSQAVDPQGNIYITGGFTGSLTFNTPQGFKTIISSAYYDVFLAKYDNSGNCLWVRKAAGSSTGDDSLSIDGAIAIAVDKSGNVYVGGGFVKTLSFLDEQDNVVASLSSADTSLYNFELFAAKYNTDGNLLWAQGGNSGSHGSAANLKSGINGVTSIILDAENLPYIGGRFAGENFLGNNVGLEEDGDFFLAALDPDNGEVIWGEILGTDGEDGVLALSMDIYGYINALGFMAQGSIPFPTFPETEITNENENSDTFITKFDVNGNCLWVDVIGGDEPIRGVSIAADTLGNIFLAGDFSGTATFTGSDIQLIATGELGDGYLAKYDFNGNALWARRFGGEKYTQSNNVVVDEIGNSFVFGIFESSVVFGSEFPGNEVTFTTDSWVDMFVAAYDSAGNYLWTKKLNDSGYGGVSQISNLFSPGKSEQVSISNNPLSLSYNNFGGGQLILSGDFNKQIFLDEITLTAEEGSRNSFISKLNLTGNPTDVNSISNLPTDFSLSQNYPNPFNPSTIISYQLPEQSNVSLKIYDMLGREIKTLVNDVKPAGIYNVNFNADNISSGIYFYTLNTHGFTQSKKMMLVK